MITDAGTLLERGRELEAVAHAVTEARSGHGRVVVVEASAGIGKTSLLRAAGEAADEFGF